MDSCELESDTGCKRASAATETIVDAPLVVKGGTFYSSYGYESQAQSMFLEKVYHDTETAKQNPGGQAWSAHWEVFPGTHKAP